MAEIAPVSRSNLEKSVKEQIMLSITLTFDEKDQLIRQLSTLTDVQLQQLHAVFQEEKQRKEALLHDFFAKNPQLFPEYERFSQEHISSIYHGVEEEEKQGEDQRLNALLQANF